MKHKKLTALILCFTMMFSITSGIFSAAFASDSTTGSAYHLDTTTGSSISTGRVWDSTTNGAYDIEKDKNESSSKPLMLFSTKAATTTPSASEYEANIGKIAVFNGAFDDSFLVLEKEPNASWNDNTLIFYKTDFSEDIQFEITSCVVWTDTYDITDEVSGEVTGQKTEQTLWYQVDITAGTAISFEDTTTGEKISFQDGYWIMQNYLNEEDAYEQDVLILSDAVLEATNPCAICGVVNCTTAHLYCETCGKFDCGQTHPQPEPIRPATAPVIPENPTLTEGADVSIVDEYGDAVTEDGFILAAGMRSSLSAWSDLENAGNVSYQWQICYDKDNNNNLWTDIQNQTGKGILISPAMVQSIIDATGEALIRCEITSGDTVQYSAEIPVTVAQSASPAMARFALARETGADIATTADIETRASDTYSVVVNYKFEDDTIVADPYTATLAAGSNFSATVKFPTVQGYLPYLGTDTTSSTSIELNIENIQANVTYTVTYKPTLVNYKVIHYQQNLTDDKYTKVAEKTLQGLTKSTVDEEKVETNYPGFYALLYEKPAIAADGSTEVEVYYDRNYYLVNFELDGGYGTEPIYGRYGALITADNPNKAGYTFAGWSLNGITAVDLAETITENVTYIALWTPGNPVNYTVVYWRENADNTNYSYWTQQIMQATPGSTVSGSDSVAQYVNDEAYFTYNDALTDKNVEIEGDGSTIINVYYNRNYYTVYFTGISGQCVLEEHTHGTNCISELICGTNGHTHNAGCERTLVCELEEHVHTNECLICGKTEHITHTDACLTCGKVEHIEHTDDCIKCGKTEHTHSSDCCIKEVHTHSAICKITSTSACDGTHASIFPSEGTTYDHAFSNKTCVYHNGAWYQYGSVNNCGKEEHTHNGTDCEYCKENLESHSHTEACYTGCEIHTHDNGCYTNCEIHTHSTECYNHSAHSHTEDCYGYQCGQEPHTHDSTCYRECYKPVHTHDNSCTQNRDDNVIYVITAKYEQNISDVWPTPDKFSDVNLRGWKIDDSSTTQTSKVLTMTNNLCDTGDGIITSFAVIGSDCLDHLYYMFESFDQTSAANGNNRILSDGIYYDKSPIYSQDVNSSGGTWNAKAITGMNAVEVIVDRLKGTRDNPTERNVFLYYTRDRFALMFHNVNDVTKTVENIMYEQPLANYKDSNNNLLSTYEPPYPSDSYEANTMQFEGWYTTPECFDGTKVDFATLTMPNSDLTLYAKWVPIGHTVSFYLDKEAYEAGTKLATHPDVTVPHGGKVTPTPATPDNGDYSFVAWFYMDGNVEKAFDFANMRVTKDMDVYGKWSSNVLKQYFVYFKIQGTDTEIADSITGSSKAGETKTFDAKGDADLYVDYREGYFPLVKSHSMTLDIENDANNIFTFWYVQKDAVPYTVYYVAETLKDGENAANYKTITCDGKTYYIIADTVVNSENRKAVVTEKFKRISGYVPDAYQKRLVVDGSEGAVNEIIFYYSVDSTHAYYKITHYTQNTDGENWTEYASSEALGDIGTTYTASPLTIDGFTYDSTVAGTVVSGELTANGLELKLYYVRNTYPYEVRYLELGTDKQLQAPKTGKDKYGKVIGENASDINGYTAVAPTSQTLTIKIEEGETAVNNVITFYYVEKDAKINYVVVPDGCGKVSLASETVKVLTGAAQGSTATANAGYTFTGWYSDADCTTQVSTDAKYVPTRPAETGWPDEITYYAKFELDIADLTITKSGWNSIDENQSFIFTVTGPNGFTLDVVIHGNGSVTIKDLPIGEYTVTEKTDWSWRYTDTPDWTFVTDGNTDASGENNAVATITLGASGNVITFTNNRSKIYWLDGGTWCDNLFDGTNTTDTPSGRTKNLSIAFADIVLREETTDDDELTVQLA